MFVLSSTNEVPYGNLAHDLPCCYVKEVYSMLSEASGSRQTVYTQVFNILGNLTIFVNGDGKRGAQR